MDPITLALLGSTGLSAIGSFMGAGESSRANKENQRIAQMNFQQAMLDRQERERDRQLAIEMADQQRSDARLGMSDPTGRAYFDPQRGWVTELSPIGQAMLDNSTAGIARANQAGTTATDILREFNNFRPITGERMGGLLYDKATRGINDAFQGQLNTGLRTATRQGNDRLAGAIIGDLGKKQAEAHRDAAIDSEIKGRQYADSYNTGQRNALSNLYGAFAGQAVAPTPFTGPSRFIPGAASEASGAGRNLLTAAMAGRPTLPQMPGVQADNSMASALSSVGQLGYGAVKDYRSQQNLADQIALLQERYGTTPKTRNIGAF
jgi:hypothetical protein